MAPTLAQGQAAATTNAEANRIKLSQLVPSQNMKDWPDAVVSAVLESPNPKEKAKQIGPALEEIKKAAGKSAQFAIKALTDERVAQLFVQFPAEFVEIAKAAEETSYYALGVLGDERASALFVQHPKEFVEIAKAAGEWARDAFNAVVNLAIAEQLSPYIDELMAMTKYVVRKLVRATFHALENPDIAKLFIDYCEGRCKFDNLIIPIIASNDVAIELGLPIDILHDNTSERMKYLNSLSTIQAFGLLISNPEYFYTTSNHLLFDRLKNDLGRRSINDLFKEYGLFGTELHQNFLFRTINCDRFYEKPNSLLQPSDLKDTIDVLFAPLFPPEGVINAKFDQTYFFQLANAIDSIKDIPELRDELNMRLAKRLDELNNKWGALTDDEEQIKSALEYIVWSMDNNTPLVPEDRKAVIQELDKNMTSFIRQNYEVDGKLRIIQVFDKEDTEKDHWGLTQEWFSKKYGPPVTGGSGELIYENENTSVVLFMGENEDENKQFVSKQVEENPNMIITFRGHSFSLMENFPSDTFQNKEGHVLFIPGSCGSAGSTSAYISANKDTDLRFFSNTSTGRGQVTNAILDILINTPEKERFNELLQANHATIESNGGDVATIKVWGPGEALLAYVFSAQKPKT